MTRGENSWSFSEVTGFWRGRRSRLNTKGTLGPRLRVGFAFCLDVLRAASTYATLPCCFDFTVLLATHRAASSATVLLQAAGADQVSHLVGANRLKRKDDFSLGEKTEFSVCLKQNHDFQPSAWHRATWISSCHLGRYVPRSCRAWSARALRSGRVSGRREQAEG